MKKLLTLFTLLLCVCSGAWADNYTDTYTNPASGSGLAGNSNGMGAFTEIGSLTGKVSFGNSALQIGTNGGSGTFVISTIDGSAITGITLTQFSTHPVGTLTSEDGYITKDGDVFTFTPSTSKSSAAFSMTAPSGGKVRIAPIVVNLTSNYEYFSMNFSVTDGVISCTKSNASSDVTLTTTGSASSNRLSIGSGKTLTVRSTGHKIKAVHFTFINHASVTLAASTGTYDSNTWTAGEDTQNVTFTSSGSNTIGALSVELEDLDSRVAIPLTFSANVPTLVAGQKTTTTLEKTLGDGDTDSKYSVGYSSSNESVATVDANGIITAEAAGTATITATVTADDYAYYKGNTASVEIAVTAGAGYVENFPMINYPTSQSGITNGSDCSFTTVKINANSNSVNAMKMGSSYSEDKRFTLSLSGGFKTGDIIKYAGVYNHDDSKNAAIDIYGQNEGEDAEKLTTSNNFINGKLESASPEDQTYTLLADYDNLYIGRNGNTSTYLTKLQITRSGYNVPVTSAGFATLYASDKSLDFSAATSVEAYIVTDATAEGAQTQKVTKVPAGTPLLIKSVSGDAVNEMIKVSPAETDDVDDNILKANGVTGDESTVYVLGAKDGKAVWGLLKNGSHLPEGKVYFKTDAPLAKEFLNIIINDTEETSSETDGINKVSTNLENGVRYNLAGQKVSKDYKGIVIVNGRKMLNK